MYYPPAKFGDDTSSDFCFKSADTYTCMYRAGNCPTHAGDYVSVSNHKKMNCIFFVYLCGVFCIFYVLGAIKPVMPLNLLASNNNELSEHL